MTVLVVCSRGSGKIMNSVTHLPLSHIGIMKLVILIFRVSYFGHINKKNITLGGQHYLYNYLSQIAAFEITGKISYISHTVQTF